MIVGEQPGDREDRVGRPFVGRPENCSMMPWTRLASIARPFTLRTSLNISSGLHRNAASGAFTRSRARPKVRACSPWLEAELQAVKPKILVCMGATAAQALVGKHVSVARNHGQGVESAHAPFAIATLHPSSILRAIDAASRQRQMAEFINDLRLVARLAAKKQAA